MILGDSHYDLGRDVLSRLIYGACVIRFAGLLATADGAIIGIPLGLPAGLSRRTWLDSALTRIIETTMSFPSLVIALGIVGALRAEPLLRDAAMATHIVHAGDVHVEHLAALWASGMTAGRMTVRDAVRRPPCAAGLVASLLIVHVSYFQHEM
ncbi:MAG: ABC transporter permease subunit [Nocardioidaceae bacterium]